MYIYKVAYLIVAKKQIFYYRYLSDTSQIYLICDSKSKFKIMVSPQPHNVQWEPLPTFFDYTTTLEKNTYSLNITEWRFRHNRTWVDRSFGRGQAIDVPHKKVLKNGIQNLHTQIYKLVRPNTKSTFTYLQASQT